MLHMAIVQMICHESHPCSLLQKKRLFVHNKFKVYTQLVKDIEISRKQLHLNPFINKNQAHPDPSPKGRRVITYRIIS